MKFKKNDTFLTKDELIEMTVELSQKKMKRLLS